MPGLLIGLIGGLLIAAGLAMVFVFPNMVEFQTEQFSRTGRLIGFVMIAIGAGLLVFA